MKMREYIRHPSAIPLEVKITDCPGHREEYLNNVGVGGLSFRSQDRLESGVRISIRIPLLGEFVQVSGQVVWCHKLRDAYEVGVAFLDMKEAYRTRMVEQICHIEQYKVRVWEQEHRQLTSEQAAAEWIKRYADTFPKISDEKTN
jgi:hypothetical protein